MNEDLKIMRKSINEMMQTITWLIANIFVSMCTMRSRILASVLIRLSILQLNEVINS